VIKFYNSVQNNALIKYYWSTVNISLVGKLLPFVKNKTALNKPISAELKATLGEVYVAKKEKCLLMS
tara:strand:- start:1060 stop:1260 length:201 start_codon:yes stop_codon:yes gene_type:complete